MRLLLDTQIILWALVDEPRLSKRARELLGTPGKDVYYSVASLWEIGIKHGLGRLQPSPAEAAETMSAIGYQRLQIKDEHLARVAKLPHHHRDPFDRMLVAQADSEPLKFVTADNFLKAYGPSVMVV